MCVGRDSSSHCVCNLKAGKDEYCYPAYLSYFGQVSCPWHSVYQEIRIQSMGQCRISLLSLVYLFRFLLFSFMCVYAFVRVFVQVCECPQRPEETVRLSEAGITDSCKMFHMGARN